MKKNQVLALFCSLIVLAGSSRAAQIQGVTVAASSGYYTSLSTSTPDRRAPTNLVNGIGLFGDRLSTVPGGVGWLSAAGGQVSTNFVVFDLSGAYNVSGLKVWNYNEAASGNTNRGMKTVSISYSTDGVNFTTNIASQTLNEAAGTITAFGQTVTFPSEVLANYIRIDCITNYSTTANNYAGLGKVRIISNTNAPTILSATENYGSNQVTVYFSESVDPTSATTLANYSITTTGPGSVTISNVAMGEFNDRVVLQTSPLTNQGLALVASGVYDLALTAPITNNTTVAIQPEVVLWLQANNGPLTDGNGNVTNWVDLSGYGHNAVTATVNQYSSPPTLAPGAVNGLPAVAFNGAELLDVPNDANLAINGDMTVVVVLDQTGNVAGDVISKTGGQGNPYTGTPAHGYTNNLPGPFDYQITAAHKSSWTWGNGGGGGGTGLGTLTSSGAFVSGQYYIVTASMTQGTNFAWYLNGGINGSASFITSPGDSGNPIYLGVRSDSGNPGDAGLTFTGSMAELLLIRGTVTPSDLLAVNNYLGAKYNIPIAQLAITEQPGNTTTTNGQSATFWVNAVGIPPITYQWKSNNVTITGATGAVYTTPNLTLAANNASYTVTVTTPVGATNSMAAILTVLPSSAPPGVLSAAASTNGTSVTVLFSEPVAAASALTPANYILNGSPASSAAYGSSASNSVILTVANVSTNGANLLTIQNVQDPAANTLVSTNVLVLPANLSLWLDADTGVITDTNGNVVRWMDKTANANNATQYAGGPLARPAPLSSQINGEPALNFNAANSNFLQVVTSPSVAIASNMSVYAVINVADYNAPREFLGKTAGTSSNIPASFDYYAQNSTTLRFYRGNGTGNALVTATQGPGAGSPHVISSIMQATTVNQYLDGASNGLATLVTNAADGGTPLRIGTRNDLAQFMNGDIAEILLFNGAISDNDRTNIDNYLGVKYFPFVVTQPPLSYTTNEGETATFSVAASQGSAHLSYQWVENSTNIPGATGAAYTTGILAPSDNNDTFSVIVTVPGVSTNTVGPASLTVNNVPPTVVSAGAPFWNQNSVVIVFSEAVNPATAVNTDNYSINNGASVISAVIGQTPNEVVLTTSPLVPGTSYTVSVQNVQDLYGNTISPVAVPSGIYPPSLALWIRADQGVSADGSGNVSEWDDQSGNGNDFFSGNSPVLVPNAINGLPAVQFNATNETYMGANDSPSLEIVGDMTIFAVMNFTTYSTNGIASAVGGAEIISKTGVYPNANQPAPYDYYVNYNSGPLRFLRGNGVAIGANVNAAEAAVTPSTGTPHLMDVAMQGTTVTHRLDGVTNGVGTWTTPITDAGQPVYIGARADGGIRLDGEMGEVLMFSSALSSTDIAAIEAYLGAKWLTPAISQQPVSASVPEYTAFTNVVVASGSSLSYQWYTNNTPLSGQTNSALIIDSVQLSNVSTDYYVIVSNLFGEATSSVVSLSLIPNSPPVIVTDLSPLLLEVPPGYSISYQVEVGGTPPFNYQWYLNGTTEIAGATNSVYNFPAAVGNNTYTLWVTNGYGVTNSLTATVVADIPPAMVTFANPAQWTSYGLPVFTAGTNGSLELTDGNISESRGAFFDTPQYIDGFLASFIYTPAAGTTATRADGAAFVIQNSSAGAAATGAGGGDLGYTGITPSAAFLMDLYTGSAGGTGINVGTNGQTASATHPNGGTGSVNINSLDPIGVTIYYDYSGGRIHVELEDETTTATYATNYTVGDLSTLLGTNLAYVGFTGGTGADDAVQTISNFSFTYSGSPALTITPGAGGTIILSWSGAISSQFVLMQSANVNGPWSAVGTTPDVVNGQYQVTVTPSGTAQFFELQLQL